MGPVRFIAARLRRFHKWNCPFLNRKERDTAWLGMYGELAAASFLRGEGFSVLRRNWRPVRGGELEAPGIQAYTRSVQGEGFARFMKSAAGAGRSE